VRAEVLQLAADLARRGEPFVLAVVVRREPFTSAQQGDMAVITTDGGYNGWLGGSCTQPTVTREAQLALADGKPRLLSLSPDPAREERPGVKALAMTCQSGGSVDIYLEPVLPQPRLLLFGASPVVRALARLGEAMGYSADVAEQSGPVHPDPRARVYAVVASMGENDEGMVAAALAAEPEYLGVVASRKRFAEIRATLLARGFEAAALDRIHNPAGLDIGARLPEELAVSILAEIVQLRRAMPQREETRTQEDEEIDPVCGMRVAVATARHWVERGGRTFYFCNAGCREKFVAAHEPQ
jgi:xanthine dehydrogenase accessory factor